MDEKAVIIVVVALFIGFIVFFLSRSGENYGMLKPSADVTAAFESHRPAADLDYWFSGPESQPITIIGVEKRFRFDSADHWMRGNEAEESLKRLITGMQSGALQRNRNLRGFEIVDQRGERIGEWYSTVGIQAVIKRTGIDSVEIWPPSPDKVEP
ncbi:MAG TPA: hypothetical protein VF358_01125 [Syntrophales bacterium]